MLVMEQPRAVAAAALGWSRSKQPGPKQSGHNGSAPGGSSCHVGSLGGDKKGCLISKEGMQRADCVNLEKSGFALAY